MGLWEQISRTDSQESVWVGARYLCGGTVEGFRSLSFSSQVPGQEEWVCAK